MHLVHLNLNHWNFFCPATGEQLVGDNHPFTPSSATVFCYLDQTGNFENIANEAKHVYDNLDLDECETADEIFEQFKAAYKDENVVCFVITVSGVGYGPASDTVRIGIQMNLDKDVDATFEW